MANKNTCGNCQGNGCEKCGGTGKTQRGAPRIQFDQSVFEELCKIECTEAEIAAVMGMSVDTIDRRCKEIYGRNFAEVSSVFGQSGKASLRRTINRMAETDPGIAWKVAKNRLNYKDKTEQDVTMKTKYVVGAEWEEDETEDGQEAE